mmetsp:Transcript_78022/g.137486  ORF Transcript_78022/g.137486 Transcript_78022/m.137486 type:complete len:205 (-) Transcript_78022:197-811(-)|eukprot:CAMPEP_0197653556 /NCGR_PEP_ID=MMETSP1338-20131121/36081_1 /TAXON_ID=43686 ORGANISM="Pelagodinium beii, Strain RCC1491" /NCGR_SAMPLE_ID=MMETSP1338 /ASSEMBLY_ACC=CAM_ASM_000754 /LENGTH=204 /DNA_ID=CAMNT_0043228711 /DNA_START=50 /DNA_END=664 /DNA_ORIENTATION=+
MAVFHTLLSASLVAGALSAEFNYTSSLRGGNAPSAPLEANRTPVEANSSDALPELNESLTEFTSSGYSPTEFCRTRGREGQNCISDRAYQYCSAGNPQPALSRDCWQKRGRYSRCHDGGIGLTYGECDDPFCRQQSGPPRQLCHGSAVVSCSGTGPSTAATPHMVQYCSDRQSNQNGHKVTEHYTCQESYGYAQCVFSGTSYNR